MNTQIRNKTARIVFLCVILILATGCKKSEETRLDESANGSRVELEKGQSLLLSLEANPSTGYSWEIVEMDESILQSIGEAEFTSADKSNPPVVGAGGRQTFQFKALAEGEGDLKLVYHRPWEDVEPLETFTVQVTVP